VLIALAVFTLLVVAIVVLPFVFTTPIARVALAKLFPANDPQVGSVVLTPSGILVVHGLILHDVSPSEASPLIAIREMRVEFGWRQLLSRQLQSVAINDITLYARSNPGSQLSLLDFVLQHVPATQAGAAAPFWIDAVDLNGRIHREALTGISSIVEPDGRLLLKSTMSGDRANPSRQIHLELGQVEQLRSLVLSRQQPAKDKNASQNVAKDLGKQFGIFAEARLEPIGNGSRFVVDQFAASNAEFAVDSGVLRERLPGIPSELTGRIEVGLTSITGSGQVDLADASAGQPAAGHLSGELTFSKLHLRAPGGPQLSLGIESVSGIAKVNSPLKFANASALKFDHVVIHNSNLAIADSTLRRYLPSLPTEVAGRLEIGLKDLTTAGNLSPRGPGATPHVEVSLDFDGVRVLVPGKSQPLLSSGTLAGVTRLATDLDSFGRETVNIDRLQIKNAAASVDLNMMRRYVAAIPLDLPGGVDSNLEQLDLAGNIAATSASGIGFSGNLRLQNFSAQAPLTGGNSFKLDRMTLAGSVDSQIDQWNPASTKVRDGTIKIAGLSYGSNSVANIDASWHDDGAIVACDRCAFDIFDGRILGAPAYNLATHEIPSRVVEIHSIDVHQALANLSPEHVDADGKASGTLHLAFSADGQLSGDVDLAFDGPGVLKIGDIQEVKQMLVGNVGMDLANLAMHDLQHYPFKEGSLHLESAGRNTLLKIKFLRQPKTAADSITPHKEIINGQAVMVGSLVVPVIDMTIPMTGQSLAEILALVSGVHPLIQTATEPSHN
jgi:hypothetical protein